MRFRSRATVAGWAAMFLALAGFYAIVLSWQGASSTGSLALQLPFVMSGAFGGLGLIVFASVLLHVDVTRRLAAEEQAALQDVLETAARIAITRRGDSSPFSRQ